MNQQDIDEWAKRALTVLVDHVKIEGKLDGLSRDAATRLSIRVIEAVTVPNNNILKPTRAEGATSARG